MHKQIPINRSLDTLFAGLGIAFLLLFVLSTTASAATPCQLSFTMSDSSSSISSGGTITRALTVKNIGGTTCRDTALSMYYGNNETFVSSSPASTASNYYWYIGALKAGKQWRATVTTNNNTNVTGTTIATEGCASATGAADSCADSVVSITGSTPSSTTSGATTTIVTTPTPTTSTATTSATGSSTTTQTTTPTTTILPATSGKEQGMWVWDFPSAMLSSVADSKLQAIQARGFNTVYITVDDYLDIANMTDGAAKTSAITTYFTNLAAFVKKANGYGMQVDAEAGWRDWAYTSNRYKGFAMIDMVKAYNAAHPEARLRGFQYDVEPYLLPEYETNKGPVLTDYVGFIDQSVQRLVGTDIQFSICIPHFYDDVNQWTPPITYNGTTDYTYNQLLKVLEKKPGSEILLMSYRNFFDGTNGTRAISETEVNEATGTHTKVIVGQETGNVDPAYVTFYGMSKTDVTNAISTIGTAFSSYSNYAGTAVDYLDPYMALSN